MAPACTRSALVVVAVAASVTLAAHAMACHAAPVTATTASARTGAIAAGPAPAGFLNGVNQAWVNYGNDFGNRQGNGTLPKFITTLDGIKASGGNAMRTWIHCTGDSTPAWAPDGSVSAPDGGAGTFFSDLQALLSAAEARGVKVMFSIWNGALMEANLKGLIMDSTAHANGGAGPKLQSYFDKVLTPMVTKLAGSPALAGFEVMNEPEGSVAAGVKNSDSCLDTTGLAGTGAGWSGGNLPMPQLIAFIAHHVKTIHTAAPSVVVTVGSWSQAALTPKLLWSDECLTAAAGAPTHLDVYEVHSYAYQNKYAPNAPLLVKASSYGLSKPLIIGEFSQISGAGLTSADQYYHAATTGYAGAWGWQANGSGQGSDDLATLEKGMRAASGMDPPPQPPKCKDVPPPPATYSCEQQKSWGKCSESWMVGYCCLTCFDCKAGCGAQL